MLTIYKYMIAPVKEQRVPLPKGARILSFDQVSNMTYIWALVDPDAESEIRTFHLYATGCEISAKPENLVFIGTAIVDDGRYVVHLFEVKGS